MIVAPSIPTKTRPVERVAPGVITRQSVNQPVQTGIKAIDSMIPIGRGQRELIIGDRQTGKTAVAIDTIINQKGKDLHLYLRRDRPEKLYLLHAQWLSLKSMARWSIRSSLHQAHADPAPLKYLAPYAGCAMGEEFMENGPRCLDRL